MKKSARRKHQYDVFLSHNTNDKPQVEILAARLENEAKLKPFLDKWHLVPGDPWQEGLEKALDQSATCAVFLGPSGLGVWENEEMRLALEERVRNNSFRVIPVLLPQADPGNKDSLPRFLRRLRWVDFRAGLDDQEAFGDLVAGIRGLPPGRRPKTMRPTEPTRFRHWKVYLVCLLLLGIAGWFVFNRLRRPLPECGQFSASLYNFNKNQWVIPKTANYQIHQDYGLSLIKVPTPIFLSQRCFYSNFEMRFHAKLTENGGAAWAVRVNNENDYYLFYLAGPGSQMPELGFYFYIVRNNKFDPNNHQGFFPRDFAKYLSKGVEFDVLVKVTGQHIENYITLAIVGLEDKPLIDDVGKQLLLGQVDDSNRYFAKGSIGFRTIGAEQFSVDSIYVNPLP
ncbi:MAG: toll/interleukin-1 receptor domain-containing protein [Acidobacteriota bacterium]